jgi:metallo-beta-lactamase class B
MTIKFRTPLGLGIAFALAASIAAPAVQAQTQSSITLSNTQADAVEAHLSAAKQAAAFDLTGTLARLCIAPGLGSGGTKKETVRPIPDSALWHAEPVRMFDNLYFVGTKLHSSWALTTSQGIILIDTLYNYAVEDEIVGGLKKVGLDPATVKYVIVSHGHSDHDEGARLFQERYGARIVMGGPDWELIEKGPDMPGGKPKRDIVGVDGQKITLGDTSVTLVATPGHTPGTLSMLFGVKDNGKPLTVAYSGGTAIYDVYQSVAGLNTYIDSQVHMGKVAAEAKATVLMSNHTEFDGAYIKGRLLAGRRPGEAHPYDLGPTLVQRYFKLTDECALAARARLQGS